MAKQHIDLEFEGEEYYLNSGGNSDDVIRVR